METDKYADETRKMEEMRRHTYKEADAAQPIRTENQTTLGGVSYGGPARELTITELLDMRAEQLQKQGAAGVNQGERMLSMAADLRNLRDALPTRMHPCAERAMRDLLNFRY